MMKIMNDLYEDEYEFCDFLETFNSNDLEFGCERFVYIPKDFYDIQVSCGQETDSKVRHQIEIDIPRCDFNIEGESHKFCPDSIPTRVKKYCTQAVMAVPVEALTKFGIVAESLKPKPLKVDVWGPHVCAQKKLRIFNRDYWIPIDVKINAEMDDPCVVMKIRSSTK